jgi:hypothetical protein
MRLIYKNWRLALQTLPFALVVVVLKFLAFNFGLEVITVNALYTSVVAGSIFLFGLILAGTLTDYKESERMPAEIASACRSIFEEGKYLKETHPSFSLSKLGMALVNVITGFKEDVEKTGARKSIEALTALTSIFNAMEKTGLPPAYIVRIKNEQAAIRKCLLRFYYIQRINFLPSAYVLVVSMIMLVIMMLIFSRV